MSNKKSYMDRKNILSEGFLQSFIKTIIPQSIKKPIIDKRILLNGNMLFRPYINNN